MYHGTLSIKLFCPIQTKTYSGYEFLMLTKKLKAGYKRFADLQKEYFDVIEKNNLPKNFLIYVILDIFKKLYVVKYYKSNTVSNLY